MQQVISTIVETGVMSTYTYDDGSIWQKEVHPNDSSRIGLKQLSVNLSNPFNWVIKSAAHIFHENILP